MAKMKFQYVQTHHGVETLLEFLTRRFRYHSPEEWQAHVFEGHVQVNGERVLPDHLLATRQTIVYDPPPAPEPPIDERYEVLFEDEVLLAVSKSGNIPTSPSGKYWHNCLVHLLQRERETREIYAVHRLDRETSGVNLFAKTKEVAAKLGDDFFHNRTGKFYTALLAGEMADAEVLVDAPLMGDRSGLVKIKQYARPEGKPSETRFIRREVISGATLVDVEPLTGRTHQIRAHAAHFGHPVLGDLLYGGDEQQFIDWISAPDKDYSRRHLLHATRLTIAHPVSGEPVSFHAPDGVLLEAFRDGVHLRNRLAGSGSAEAFAKVEKTK